MATATEKSYIMDDGRVKLGSDAPPTVIEARDHLQVTQERFLELETKLATNGKLTREERSEYARLSRARKGSQRRVSTFHARISKREDERARKAEQREHAARLKRRERDEKIVARHVARLDRKLNVLVLPEGAKPSRSASKEARRPQLHGAWLTREGRGESAEWVLYATDSYQLARVPLLAHGDPKVKGKLFIPTEALVAVEKAGGFRVTKHGAIQPCKVAESMSYDEYVVVTDSGKVEKPVGSWSPEWRRVGLKTVEEIGVAYTPPKGVRVPDYKQLLAKEPPASYRLELTFDPDTLVKLAAAVKAQKGQHHVTLVVDTRRRKDAKLAKAGIRVEGMKGSHGVLMPIRRDRAEQ